MYKQNLGFIAPFALNILLYVVIWHFFFRATPEPTVESTPIPIANTSTNQEAPPTFYVAGEYHISEVSTEKSKSEE